MQAIQRIKIPQTLAGIREISIKQVPISLKRQLVLDWQRQREGYSRMQEDHNQNNKDNNMRDIFQKQRVLHFSQVDRSKEYTQDHNRRNNEKYMFRLCRTSNAMIKNLNFILQQGREIFCKQGRPRSIEPFGKLLWTLVYRTVWKRI